MDCWVDTMVEPNIVIPFYWERWKAKTSHLTREERDGYLLLLLHQWQFGYVPADKRVYQIIGGSRQNAKNIWASVRPLFKEVCPCGCDLHRNRRLEEVRAEQITYREGKSVQGSRGAASRWLSDKQGHGATRSKRLAAARAKGTHTVEEWLEMLISYNRTCLKCGGTDDEIVKDHVVPLYQGGDDSIRNIQPLCIRCNAKKGPDRTDHRVGHPSTQAQWLPAERLPVQALNASLDASPTPGFRSPISDLRTTPPQPPASQGAFRSRKPRTVTPTRHVGAGDDQRRKTLKVEQLIANGMSREDANRQVFK